MQGLLGFLPESLTFFSASILIVASFFTSALTASVGVGGGLLMLGLMTYVIPIAALIPVHGLVQLGSNTSRSFIQRAHIKWRIVFLFFLGSVFGVLAGAMLAVQIPAYLLQFILGMFLIVVVWIKLPKIQNANAVVIGFGGTITTFATMFIGATGPLVAVFLNSLFDEHRKMVATHGMVMTLQHCLKVLAFIIAGFAFWQWLPLIVLIVISGFLGAKMGTSILNKAPEVIIKRAFKFVMTVIAIDLIQSSIF